MYHCQLYWINANDTCIEFWQSNDMQATSYCSRPFVHMLIAIQHDGSLGFESLIIDCQFDSLSIYNIIIMIYFYVYMRRNKPCRLNWGCVATSRILLSNTEYSLLMMKCWQHAVVITMSAANTCNCAEEPIHFCNNI